ncbi:hypothetical protein [Aquibacillus albus]|uniref:Uncharacterized protein n=1 Tax=Aquibacillus albus TaxID=1168171 RepID=A0ABS2MZS1_9BACI|nr:hypothetical protein [Aquibacillus albus]MBM7571404.1 hypothetical protein [Aquibacillus albus]
MNDKWGAGLGAGSLFHLIESIKDPVVKWSESKSGVCAHKSIVSDSKS